MSTRCEICQEPGEVLNGTCAEGRGCALFAAYLRDQRTAAEDARRERPKRRVAFAVACVLAGFFLRDQLLQWAPSLVVSAAKVARR